MSNFKPLFVSFCYWSGCALLIPGSILMFNDDIESSEYKGGIICYIVGCGELALGAFVDLYSFLLPQKSKIKTKEATTTDISSEDSLLLESNLKKRADKASMIISLLVTIAYQLGGIFFFLGSLFYWPTIALFTKGTWIFRFGSISYITGSLLSLFAIYKKSKNNTIPKISMIMNVLMFVIYIMGAICFISGGILSQMHRPVKEYMGAWLGGSILFTMGATVGGMELIRTIKSK